MISIGYVCLELPLSPNCLDEWSINFWLSMQGKNIMLASIYESLKFLKEFDINLVKAIVNENY
jgi:Fe2+ or Zn2+ uptake regulation protein